MSEPFVPTTASNFKERWVIVCVNPANSDDKMEFASVVELNAELFRFKAEVERLKAEKDQAECDYDNCQKRLVRIDDCRCDLFMENKTLKAEVDNLRKAGEAMADQIYNEGKARGICYASNIEAWKQAKEGKPTK